jgi:predicted dehydrogenase
MEKLRFGIIGAGGITHGHAKRLAGGTEAEIVAVAEPSAQSVQSFRERTGLDPHVYGSHAEMLASERLDCVLIGSPHTLHFAQSRDCLQAGVHVLCEKPMVCSAADARALQEIITSTGRVFMISYQRHTEPKYLWMKEQVESGRLGRISYIAATSCQEWLWATRGSWRQDPALSGGGQINDTGSHFVDVMIWLGGRVEQVQAFQDFSGTRVDINSAVTMRFASGALGTFTVIGGAHAWWEDWTVSGEKGTIFYRNGRLLLAVLGQGVREVPDSELPPATAHVDQAFIDAVRGRRPVLVPASIGLGVIELTEAAWRSAADGGRPVRVAEL